MRQYQKVDNTIVGDYDSEKRTYTKLVKEREHKMWKYNGYGIQMDVLRDLKKKGCEYILIIEDGKVEYRSQIWDWFEVGTKGDFGHGEQMFLPVDEMKKSYLIK